MPGTVAIIANPAAGSDVRRLVAHATVTSDAAKISIVRRAVVAAVDAGADRILLAPDRSSLCERAVDGLDLDARVDALATRVHGEAGDTRRAATAAREEHAGALMVLGGDGTCRDAVLGWRDAPLLPVSTGTNNVFPRWLEATVAGTAAALVAGGSVSIGEAARRAKIVELGDSSWDEPDLALVDAVLVQGRFTGSRAVWEPHRLRAAVLAPDYLSALDWKPVLNAGLEEIFERCDAILCPAAPGPAPKGLGYTGNPVFNGIWTFCGTPAVTLPLLTAGNGLPIGVQLVGTPGNDARLLRMAQGKPEKADRRCQRKLLGILQGHGDRH